jgi:hypothetical protein
MAKFVKGLNKDSGQVDQPEGSYRYAKNILSNETAGAISNEPGTSKVNTRRLAAGERAIGTIETTTDLIVIFAVDTNGNSSIYLYNSNSDTIATLLNTATGAVFNGNDFDLKFNLSYPIEGTYKIDPDGNLIVYWTDNLNPPRSLNVTRQQASPSNQIYGVNPAASPNKNYIDRLNLFPHAGPVPSITFSEIAEGGALKSGVYYLFLAYVDENFTQTNYVSYSLGVPIVEDTESVLPIERYDGAPADTQTGKSIVWEASNLNTDYEYLRPIVVARVGGVERAYKLNDLDIAGPSRTIVFSLLEGYEESSVEEAIVDTVAYDTAKTITQLDSILYLGNLSGSKDIGYQKHANFIKLETVTSELEPFDPYDISSDNLMYGFLDTQAPYFDKENGYRGINNLASSALNKKGYMRDEVYAFYIAFILNDGSMSYAYHIPGRESISASKLDIRKVGPTAVLPENLDEEDSIDLGIDSDINELTGGAAKAFHFYDFAIASQYQTNFWQNENELYPNTDDYKVFDGITEVAADNLQAKNVRHHRMPTNATVPSITGNNEEFSPATDPETITYYFAFGDPDDNDNDWLSNTAGAGDTLDNLGISGVTSELTGGINNGDTSFPAGFDNACEDIVAAYGNTETWQYQSPNASLIDQDVQFLWARGTSSGATDAVITAVTDIGDAEVEINQQNSPNLFLGGGDPPGQGPINSNIGQVRYGIVIWQETVNAVSQSGQVSQTVEALGVKLSDIKIPKSIADKVQGFRIYYAERNHNNRRILGQDVIKNTADLNDIDLASCGGDDGSSASEDFILAPGTLFNGEVREATFHDFYLLNADSGQRKSLVPATHTTFEYETNFYSFTGPGHDYEDVAEEDCQLPDSYSAFHVSRSFANNPAGLAYYHYPLREKCKTYLNGDSIYDGRGIGFGKRVYNLGGESSILLGYKQNRLPSLGGWPQGVNGGAFWHTTVGAGLPFGYQAAEPVKLQLHNLQAFKTDMYLSYDTQELIWTGFEVVGDDLTNYTLQEDGTSTIGATHTTTDIYGGDTFICRHGYRITHRPEYTAEEPNDRKNLISVICESTDNINFRHEETIDSTYFPGSPAKKLLDLKANIDLTDVDNMKYNKDYSLGVADVKPPVPYPLRESDPTVFETRVQRSAKADNTSLIDNYRVHLALQFKDLPRDRGSIWKLVSLNNLLHLHTEDSLFRTKGKETIQLSDGTESFVGSGDIFTQDPDEIIQTKFGYGGTQSQWVSIVTKHGYFCMDYRNRKVFLMKDQLYDIGKQGMESWFQDNIPFTLEQYGMPGSVDNPIIGVGFHATYDEKYDRLLLTKRDLIPTQAFIDLWTVDVTDNLESWKIVWSDEYNSFVKTRQVSVDVSSGEHGSETIFQLVTEIEVIDWAADSYFTTTGWTVSYDVEMNVWVSFHDYVPYKYSRSKDTVVSLTDIYDPLINLNTYSPLLWFHNDETNRGNFYDEIYPTEFEFIYNAGKDLDKVFYSFNYMVDVFNETGALIHDHGFDSFYVYNTHQISGEREIEYMINTRRVGNEWKINKFRDLALLQQTAVGPFAGSNFGVPGASVAGTNLTSVETTTPNTMFSVTGMNETINPLFINLAKSWDKQRKFSDKWLGIRLKYSNSNKKLINLYSTDVAAKKFYR